MIVEAELIHQYDLTVLSISVDRRSRRLADGSLGPAVVFRVCRGRAEPLVLARVPLSEAVPTDAEAAADAGVDEFVPPREVLTAPELTSSASEGRPLWLDLPAIAGVLRLMAWERLLEPLGAPVLRLPSLILPPRPLQSGLEVALCASSIGMEEDDGWVETLERLVGALRAATTRHVSVHVFPNAAHVPVLRQGMGKYLDVTIHDPDQVDVSGTGRQRRGEGPPAVENPWLLWMQQRLCGVAVDHVHFFCHGAFVLDHGTVSFATTPSSTDDGYRCVGAPELLAFLTGLGAWSVGLSGPVGNLSPPGLRDLAYSISDARPGPIVQHETGGDPGCAELTDALSVSWNEGPSPAPRSTSTAVWAHPASVLPSASQPPVAVRDRSPEDPAGGPLLTEATVAALASSGTPTWVAATARVLEQAQAQWLAGSPGRPEQANRPAAVEALRTAAGLLDRHVRGAGEAGQQGRRAP